MPDHGASSILQTVASPAQPWVESRHRGHLCCRSGCDSGRPQHFARHWGKQRCLAATDEASLLRSELSLCTGPARGHTVTHAVRLHLSLCPGPVRGHTVPHAVRLHLTPAGASADSCPGPMGHIGEYPVPETVRAITLTGNTTVTRSAACTGPARGHTVLIKLRRCVWPHLGSHRCVSRTGNGTGHYARRCGYKPRRFSTGHSLG